MTVEEFKERGPEGMEAASLSLRALWSDYKGDWNAAHDLLQDDMTPDGSWVHAYLHRKEGDDANAGYWYRRAGKSAAIGTLDTEWERIVHELLADQSGK